MARSVGDVLQKKFKHAGDFGVDGNYNPDKAGEFKQAIVDHVNSPGTREIVGTYRGNPVTFHVNQNTGLVVLQEPSITVAFFSPL